MNLYYIRLRWGYDLYPEGIVSEIFVNARNYDEAYEFARKAVNEDTDGSYFIYALQPELLFVEDYEKMLAECREAFEELGTRVASKLRKDDI